MNRADPCEETERSICRMCGDMVMLPPGIYYRGEKYHKHCAQWLSMQDYSLEVVEPGFAITEERIRSILSNMRPMSEG